MFVLPALHFGKKSYGANIWNNPAKYEVAMVYLWRWAQIAVVLKQKQHTIRQRELS